MHIKNKLKRNYNTIEGWSGPQDQQNKTEISYLLMMSSDYEVTGARNGCTVSQLIT